MNNLQIALDPSCIQIKNKDGANEIQISVVLTGLSFDNIITDEEFEAAKYLLSHYYEYDALRYNKIKLYFLDENSEVIPEDIGLGIVNPIVLDIMEIAPNDAPLGQFKDYINKEISTTVDNFRERIIYQFKADESNTTIEITDDNFNESGELYDKEGNGFSNMAFANFSQLLSPLNEQAGLVLFTEPKEIIVPTGAKIKFVAFPYRQNEPAKPDKIHIDNILWKSECNPIEVDRRVGTTTTFGTHYICIETDIPTTAVEKGKIILRDKKGNFEGSVKIDVEQELEWIADYYSKIASYFDFPKLLQQFYSQPEVAISLIDEINENGSVVLQNIESDLWRLTLDPFIIHTKKMPNQEGFLDIPIIDDVDRINPNWFETWFDEILKVNLNIENLKNKLKIILISEASLKDNYNQFWSIENGTVNFDLPDKAFSKERLLDWINDWITAWSSIIESSREFNVNMDSIESETDFNKRKASLIGIQLIDVIVDFFNQYNTSYTGNKEDLIQLVIDPIQKYNESIYYYFYIKSNEDNIEGFADKMTIELPNYWDTILKSDTDADAEFPSIFDKIHGFDTPKFKEYLILSVKDKVNKINKKNDPIFDPPPIQIKVHPESRIHNPADDISDEIAGFVLLNQRSKTINSKTAFEPWSYLNSTKAKINGNLLESDFLKPLFLPEIDGMPLLSLSITNQKRSLVEPQLNIQNSNIPVEQSTESPYAMDFKSPEFWYGYHYNFAGFVVLNSGALPPVLQHKRINKYKSEDDIDFSTSTLIKSYHHLRKVALTSPNVKPQSDKNTNKFYHKSEPSDFNPLAKELDFWKDKKFNYFILSESENFNNEIKFDLIKATTSIWDWFAFEKKTFFELLNYKGTAPLYTAVKKFLEKKEGDATTDNMQIPDTAVENFILMNYCTEFPVYGNKKQFKIACDSSKPLTVKWSKEKTDFNPATNVLNIKRGEILNVKFSTLVDKKFFVEGGDDQKIDLDLIPRDDKKTILDFDSYYTFAPVSFCFEAAKHPLQNDQTDELKDEIKKTTGIVQENLIKELEKHTLKMETELWELIQVNDNGIANTHLEQDESIKVLSKSKKFNTDIDIEFAYVNQLQIRQQRWNWDGRLDVSNNLLNNYEALDPESPDYKTTPAMKWEAWSFSNRPDHTGTVQTSYLKTSKSKKVENEFSGLKEQLLTTISTKGETKALFNRFAVVAYSRYSFLDKYLPKHNPIEGKVTVDIVNGKKIKNQWKRIIQLCKRNETLPTPVVRFFIPLTASINEDLNNEYQNAAPIMVVVEGNVFNEAGLAYGLEIGVEKVTYKKEDEMNETYISFGSSPDYSSQGSKPFNGSVTDPEYLNFEPQGPLGFTFDIAAENPKVTSSAYILDLSDQNLKDAIQTLKIPDPDNNNELKDRHQAWSLMRVAVRSVIREKFHANNEDVKKLASKWSEKTWVEFAQAVNTNIPDRWVAQVNQTGIVEIDLSDFDTFPNQENEKNIERYIVVTKIESDMGGMPVESYHGTFYYDKDETDITKKLKNFEGIKLENKMQGFVRILIVHKNKHSNFDKTIDVWSQLFAEDNNKIRNDSTLARPMITKRVSAKFTK